MDLYYKRDEVVNGYSIVKVIGEGRYGIAYLAVNEKLEKCVIKQLKKDMLEKTREKLFYEKQILEGLNSSRFPKFLSIFVDGDREGYILEYVEGRVFERVLAKERHQFTKEEIYEVGSQLLEIIEELQKSNIVHRDIRLPNVIIKENNELALIDFGLARFIDDERYVKEIDYWFMADFLIHLYYSAYEGSDDEEKPWYEELNLIEEEKVFLKKLMGIEGSFKDIDEVKKQLEALKTIKTL